MTNSDSPEEDDLLIIPGSETFIGDPPLSDWHCLLFGTTGTTGYAWTPIKGEEPNWFWRWMQYLCFGNRWVKDKT